MGAVDIIVGCPHRLRQPIGPSTKYPCPGCAALGVPPRWATALTIHPSRIRPRVADMATAAPRPVADPLASIEVDRLAPIMQAAADVLNIAATAVAPLVEAVRSLPIQMGAIEVHTMPRTNADFMRNVVRMQATSIVKMGLRPR